MAASLEKVIATHEELCQEARALISSKGADYNRNAQASGDTLFNLRVAAQLGIVDNECKSVLVRLCDKLNRLISLSDANAEPQTKDESFKDTVRDAINYLVYLWVFKQEQDATKLTVPKGVGLSISEARTLATRSAKDWIEASHFEGTEP